MKKHTLIDNVDDLIELKVRKSKPILRTNTDKLIEWVPTALASIAAIRSSNDKTELGKRAALGILALGLQKGVVHLIKHTTNHVRPNPFDKHNSFPSGHTATAFMGAALFHEQLRGEEKGWATIGYAIAVGTGVLRLYQNRHWLSDVLLGATVGLLAVQASKKLVQLAPKMKTRLRVNDQRRRWMQQAPSLLQDNRN